MATRTARQLGFTLIEMLVAIAIGAAISVMAYSALDGAIKAEEKVTQVTGQIDAIDRVWQHMNGDLLYAVPRTWIDRNGDSKSALLGVFGDRLSQSDVLIAGEEDYLLQFIRSNRQNLLNQERSNLFMVGYRLTQDDDSELKSLWRDSWTPVDGSDEPKVQQRLLLDGIDTMSFNYLSTAFETYNDEAWLTGWPSAEGASSALPAAVKVTLELVPFGKVERVFGLSVAK